MHAGALCALRTSSIFVAVKHSSMTASAPAVQSRRLDRRDTARTALALADSQCPRDRRNVAMTVDEARARVRADYFELPGLTLTVAQAARLWSLGEELALTVLEDLRLSGFLVRRNDHYARG